MEEDDIERNMDVISHRKMPSKFKVLKSLMSRWLSMGKKEEILPE